MAAPVDLDGVEYNFIAAQGFSYDWGVTELDASGNPVSWAGRTVELAVRPTAKDPVVLLLTTTSPASTIAVDYPTSGHNQVHFDAADTVALTAPKTYVYDLRVDGYRKQWGTMSLRAGVTVGV